MKRTTIFLINIIFMLLIATGCGTINEEADTKELVRAGSVNYDRAYITVGFVQTGKEAEWRDANTNDYLNTFTEVNGYRFIYVDANSDIDRQRKAVSDLIAQKVDYIILDPLVEDGWEDILIAAREKNICVIISNGHISADSSLYTCRIGSDFRQEGIKAMKWLADYLERREWTDENLKIAIITGSEENYSSNERAEGIYDELKEHPNWQVVAIECGNYTARDGKSAMEKIINKTKDIDVLIALNDNMMFGAMKAMNNAGITYGVDNQVMTISFEAIHDAFLKLISGELLASIECNPLIAKMADNTIQDLESRKEIEKTQYTEENVFTYLNAFKYLRTREY